MENVEQINLNRLNKAASRFNALRHGIDAKKQIIRGESTAGLERLTAEYQDRFHPANPEERLCVDILIDSEWLLRRHRMVKAELWEHQREFIYQPGDDILHGPAFDRGPTKFARLQRRVDSAHRNYHRALRELQSLQSPSGQPIANDPRLVRS